MLVMTAGPRRLAADDADDNLYDPHSFGDVYSSPSYTTTLDDDDDHHHHDHHHPSSSSLKGSPSPTSTTTTTTRRTIDPAVTSKKIPRRAIDLFAGLKLKGRFSKNTKKRRRRSIVAAPGMTIAIAGAGAGVVGKEGSKSGGNFSSSSELVKKSEFKVYLLRGSNKKCGVGLGLFFFFFF